MDPRSRQQLLRGEVYFQIDQMYNILDVMYVIFYIELRFINIV